MKQSIFYTFLGALALTSSAFAETCEPTCPPVACPPKDCCPPVVVQNPCCFGGFYIGAAIGYGSHKARTDQRVVTTYQIQDPGDQFSLVDVDVDRSYRNDLSLDGMNGGLYAGFGQTTWCNRIYLGFEGGYFWDRSKGKYTYTPNANGIADLLRTEVKRKDGVEVAGRIGLVFNQTMPYLKLGWANTKIEATQVVVPHNAGTDGDGNALPPVDAISSVPGNPLTQTFLSKRINGFLVGAGIDVKLSPCWIMGMEYTYTLYPKKRGPLQIANTIGNPVSSTNGWDSAVRLSENKFRLRLTYQF